MDPVVGMKFVMPSKSPLFSFITSSLFKLNSSTRFNNFDEYTEAISKLLTERLSYQPNEQTIMMEYIPYIQQMISANSKTKAVKTRSKRKRLYLPLSDESVNILTFDRPIIDEVSLFFFHCFGIEKDTNYSSSLFRLSFG